MIVNEENRKGYVLGVNLYKVYLKSKLFFKRKRLTEEEKNSIKKCLDEIKEINRLSKNIDRQKRGAYTGRT